MRVAKLILLLAHVGDCRKDMFMTVDCPGSSFVTVRSPGGIEHSVSFENNSGAEAVISASAPGKYNYICQEGEYGFSYATEGIGLHIKAGKGYVSHGFTADDEDTVMGDVKCLLEKGQKTQVTTYRVQAGRTKQIPAEFILRSDGESYSCSINIRSGGRIMDKATFVHRKSEGQRKDAEADNSETKVPRKKATTRTTTTTTVSPANISRSTIDVDQGNVTGISNIETVTSTGKPPSVHRELIPEEEPEDADKEDIHSDDGKHLNIDHDGSGSDDYADSDYGNYSIQETGNDDWGRANNTDTNNNNGEGVGNIETIIIAVAVVGIIVFAFMAAGAAILRDTRRNSAMNDAFQGNNPAGGLPPPRTDSYLIPHPDSSRKGQEGLHAHEEIEDAVGVNEGAGGSVGLAPLASSEDDKSNGSGQHGIDDDEADSDALEQIAIDQNVNKKKGVKGPPKPGRSYTHLLPEYNFDKNNYDPLKLRRAFNQAQKFPGYDVSTNWGVPIKDNKVKQLIMSFEGNNGEKTNRDIGDEEAVNEGQSSNNGIEV